MNLQVIENALSTAFEESDKELTMSTKEISDLTGKRHDNILRDTRKLLKNLGLEGLLKFEETYKDRQGKDQLCFYLNKELAITLVSKYDDAMRYSIVKRWQELEEAEAAKRAKDPALYMALDVIKSRAKLQEVEGQLETTQLQLEVAQTTANDNAVAAVKAQKQVDKLTVAEEIPENYVISTSLLDYLRTQDNKPITRPKFLQLCVDNDLVVYDESDTSVKHKPSNKSRQLGFNTMRQQSKVSTDKGRTIAVYRLFWNLEHIVGIANELGLAINQPKLAFDQSPRYSRV